jgi:hypothetical protein
MEREIDHALKGPFLPIVRKQGASSFSYIDRPLDYLTVQTRFGLSSNMFGWFFTKYKYEDIMFRTGKT